MNLLKICSLLLFFPLINSCSDRVELKTVNLSMRIPPSLSNFLTTKDFSPLVTNPSTIGEVNCIGIFLEYANIGNTKSCTLEDGSIVPFQFEGGLAPFTATGATIQISDVIVGEEVIANIIGFNVASASDCPNFDSVEIDDFEPGEGNVSDGFLLSSQSFVVEINANVDINLPTSQTIASADEIEDCFFADEDPDEADETFGDGSDGNFNFTNSINLSTGTMGNGQYYTSYDRVNSVSGTTIVLNDPITNRFEQGDMVLFYVAGEGTPVECGSNDLAPGSFEFIKVAATSPPNTLILESEIASDITNAHLIASPVQASSFCFIQAIRVPQFENLTIDSSGSALTFDSKGFTYPPPYGGGVIAIKVSDTLTFTGANAITVDMSHKGFAAGTAALAQGDSFTGLGQVSGVNNQSGGAGAIAASAGAVGGASSRADGGASQGNTTASPFALPNNPNCDAGTTHCLFFGSGGGAGDLIGTGNGGGIVIIQANNIVFNNTGATEINVSGQDAPGGIPLGSAGGAGGDIWIQANTITTSAAGTFNLQATGGDGGGGGDVLNYRGGGGGAGGFALFDYCSGTLPTVNQNFNGGAPGVGETAGPAQALPGNSGNANLNPGTCF